MTGFVLSGTTCGTTCADGFYEEDQVCKECTSPCATCSGSATNCVTCLDSQLLLDGECYEECPDGYKESGSKCVKGTSTSGTLIYFPFVILAVVLFFVSLGGKLKDMSSLLFSNFIVLLSVEETIFLIVQWAVAIGTMESESNTEETETAWWNLLTSTN